MTLAVATRNLMTCLTAGLLASASVADDGFDDQTPPINEIIGLFDSELVSLDLTRLEPGVAFSIDLPIEGESRTVDFWPHSVRADSYEILTQLDSGELVPHPAGPMRTLRGMVGGMPSSDVRGALHEDGLHGVIRDTATGDSWWFEPVAAHVDGVEPDLHVIYRGEDVIGTGGTCGTGPEHGAPLADGDGDFLGGPLAGGATFCTLLAVDADFDYYQDFGQNVSSVEGRINLIINTMNGQYVSELDITHVIGTIIVRTSQISNPYSTNSAGGLLDQFRSEWLSNQGGINRNVAHLFTGRNLTGSTIGVAWVGAICNGSLGFSLVQRLGSLTCETDLSAHELGHNWGAGHCSCGGNTMNAGLTCANTFNASQTIPNIINFRNSISACLNDCEGSPITYCSAASSGTGAEHIVSADLDGTVINSGSEGYGDFTSTFVTAERTESFVVTLTLANGSANTIGGIWVDWSGDGDFDDALETITTTLNGAGPYVRSFIIPGSQPLGTRRMRVRIQDLSVNFSLNACGDTAFGEVEDYDLEIIDPIPDPPPNDNCVDSTPVSEGSFNFDSENATTDGPVEVPCVIAGDPEVQADVWFRYTASCTGLATIDTCGSEFNTKLAAYSDSCPLVSGETLACNVNFCGEQSTIPLPTTQGESYLIRVGGFQGATGEGTLTINCVPFDPPCPSDLDDDGNTGFSDLVILLQSWGPCGVCPEDIDGDGTVGFADLVEILTNWGDCG